MHAAPENTLTTFTALLTDAERNALQQKKNKLLLFAIAAYILIAVVCIIFYFSGKQKANLDNKSFRVHFSPGDTEGFRQAVPDICLAILAVSTLLFLYFIFWFLMPLIKDLRNGIKKVILFKPAFTGKNENGLFPLSLPEGRNNTVYLTEAEYNLVDTPDEMCIEVTPGAGQLLRLLQGNRVIRTF